MLTYSYIITKIHLLTARLCFLYKETENRNLTFWWQETYIINQYQSGRRWQLITLFLLKYQGVFFHLYFFPFIPRCILFPPILVIPLAYTYWHVYTHTHTHTSSCRRFFFWSTLVFLWSCIWLNSSPPSLVSVKEWPLLKA